MLLGKPSILQPGAIRRRLMTRILLIVVGIFMTLGVLVLGQRLQAGIELASVRNPSSQMAFAADPTMKYISEDSPYMRSER
jgi:hypothetical protein